MKNEKLALLLAGVAVGAAAVGTIAICVAVKNAKKKRKLLKNIVYFPLKPEKKYKA